MSSFSIGCNIFLIVDFDIVCFVLELFSIMLFLKILNAICCFDAGIFNAAKIKLSPHIT